MNGKREKKARDMSFDGFNFADLLLKMRCQPVKLGKGHKSVLLFHYSETVQKYAWP